ncbi:MAG: gliding motility-associated ABC transporter ATP-binding subunit GldA [Aureispira sp.]|nr:gliding motility-associated ABC transporter ATP-binding subunit GldA [Aureispira sp.]
MSVLVQNLTKTYGPQNAVDNLSFEASKGQILGFLGPNGAGKTTTMKIITCFIPQTSGQVTVSGFDTAESPMEVRKRIGYLPEHNPLYKDMYVREYLLFIAGLHKIKNKKQAVDAMIEQTGLTREAHKIIGSLSKGFRQRVGLAQAMLHNPEVLILDEPTSGLDPNQLIEIRSLIKKMSEEKTVIFSSHIMQEVQALCDHVIIINKGKMVADGSIEELQHQAAGETLITLEFAGTIDPNRLKTIEGITSVEKLSNSRFQIHASSKKDIRPDLFQFAVQNKLVLLEMHQELFTIENVFQKLTK